MPLDSHPVLVDSARTEAPEPAASTLDLRTWQVRQAFGRQRSSLVWTLGAMALLLAPFLMFWSSTRAGVWLLVLSGVLALRTAFGLRYAKASGAEQGAPHWHALFVAGAAAAGLSWSCGPLLLGPQATQAQALLMALMLVGVSAIAVAQMAMLLPAAMAFVVTALGPTAGVLALRGTDIDRVTALSVAVLGLMLLLTGRTSHRAQISLLHAERRLQAALREAQASAEGAAALARARAVELERLSILVAGTQAGLAELDVTSGRISVNGCFADLLGRSVASLEALTPEAFADLFHPDDLPAFALEYDDLMRGTRSEVDALVRLRHLDGRWVWCQLRVRVLARAPSGEPLLVSGTYVDVTERLEAEQRWRSRAELSGDWFWETDPQFRVTLLSDGVRFGLPIPRSNLIGRTLAEVPELRPLDSGWQPLVDALAARKPFRDFALVIRPEGAAGDGREASVVELDGRPRYGGRGEFLGYEGVGRDVTERRRATDSLKDNLMLVDGLFEAMPVPVLMKDAQGRYVRANRVYRELMAAVDREVRHVHEISDRAAAELHHAIDQELLQRPGIRRYEVRQTMDSGRVIDGLVHKATLVAADGSVRGLVATLIDITDVRAAAAALQAARDAAEQANRAKSAFLATMSHELRTPLNAVIGAAQLLRSTDARSREHGTLLDAVESSGLALLGLVESVMDLSRIEAAELRLSAEPFDLVRCVQDAVATASIGARDRDLRIETVFDRDLVAARRGDGPRLRQVLINLLGNAIKFTPAGRVVVEVRRGDAPPQTLPPSVADAEPGAAGWVTLGVSDTGIGIRAEDFEVIFEPFRQVEAGASRRFPGSGLGLAIVRELVRAMGGQVRVQSEPGRGSRFEVCVPLPLAGPEVAAMATPGLEGIRAPEASAVRAGGEPAEPAPSERPCWERSPLRVLLVEDDPTNQVIAAGMLGLRGHAVQIVDEALAALERLEREPFDLVLMDCQLPGVDGLELTRRIRAGAAGARAARVPIVAVTANAFVEDRAACLAAGMDDFVSKPLRLEALLETVARWTGRSSRSG